MDEAHGQPDEQPGAGGDGGICGGAAVRKLDGRVQHAGCAAALRARLCPGRRTLVAAALLRSAHTPPALACRLCVPAPCY